jgi:3alpha(or 20beta)-hydroxysteroid dehydrogenase
MTDQELAGKVIVITGAARGQGAAQAAACTAAGATVIALDIKASPHVRKHDVSSEADWAALAERIRRDHGIVHGLVNNAGITHRARLLDVEVSDLARVMGVNLTGPLLGIQALVPLMTEGGSIVNIGSVAALTAHYPIAYTTSKWALRGLSQVAAMELGPRRIRVNTLHPGFIETEMTASASPAFLQTSLAQSSLGRPGQPTEVAALVTSCCPTRPASSPALTFPSTAVKPVTAAPNPFPTRCAPLLRLHPAKDNDVRVLPRQLRLEPGRCRHPE